MVHILSKVFNKLSPPSPQEAPKFQEQVPHPGYAGTTSHLIQLGVGRNEKFIWNAYSCGNLFIAGAPGTGKSFIQHSIIRHCLYHSDTWMVKGINLHREEFLSYMHSDTPLDTLATTLEDSVQLLREVKALVLERRDILDFSNKNFSDMSPPLKRVLVVIDEMGDIIGSPMEPAEFTSAEVRALQDEAHELIEYLAKNACAAGINLVIGSYSPTSKLSGWLKDSFYPFIALGGRDPEKDRENFRNKPLMPGKIRGRGYISTILGVDEFQSYALDK